MTVHGTARWAEREELHAQGYLPEFSRAPAGQLLVGFWNDLTAIRYSGDLHQLIVGGTGGGKFTTALAPMLLSGMERATVVAVDPKGEMAKLAGPYFQAAFAAKPSVFLLDPWDVGATGATHGLNVLDEITADNPNSVDDARALADSIVIPSGAENTHWDNAGRNLLTSVILYVALDPSEAGKRDLVRVREIVTLPWQMPKAYVGPKQPTLMELLVNNLQSAVAGGAIKRGFASLLNREEKERSGILSSVERETAWIDSPQMEKVLKSDPRLELKTVGDGANKYFIVLPPEYFMTHRAWLRLTVTAFAKAMKRYQPSPQAPWPQWRHIIIDEFANLGEMSFILNEVAIARGYGVKYHFAVQDLTQLKRVYKDGWESFINNSFQRFFAIGDLFTADYVSRMLGSATVESLSTSQGSSQNWGSSTSEGINTSKGHNSGAATAPFTHSYGDGRSESVGYSDGKGTTSGHSVSQVQRPLKTPDEVRRIHEGMQVVFFRGLHPVLCLRLPYWQVFASLPTFTLKEVLGTIGKPTNPTALAYFTNWRMDGQMLKPRRGPIIAWRSPPWLPELSGYLLKAAVFLLVAGGLVYGFFDLAFPRPPQRTESRAAVTVTVPERLAPDVLYERIMRSETESLRPDNPERRAAEEFKTAVAVLDRQLLPYVTARLNQVRGSLLEKALRAHALCLPECRSNVEDFVQLFDYVETTPELLNPGKGPDAVRYINWWRYPLRSPGGETGEVRGALVWSVTADASLIEHLDLRADVPELTDRWRSAVSEILAGRGIDVKRLDRACASGVVERQMSEAFGCFNGGRQVRLWQRGSLQMPTTLTFQVPVPPCERGQKPRPESRCAPLPMDKQATPSAMNLNPANVPSAVNPLADKPVGIK